MDTELLQGMIDIVFKGNLVFLSPFLFLLMGILFADRLIVLMIEAFSNSGSNRRGRY